MRGRSRKSVIIGIGIVMLMGISVYLRLWTIDYRISSEDTDLIRWVPPPFDPFCIPVSDSINFESLLIW